MYSQNQYDTGTPIYLQIIQRFRQKIVSGEWSPGDRVAPVRDLALEFGVNPNTMQRSLSELERDGFVYSERTAGRFITNDSNLINKAKDTMALEIVRAFISQMTQMGYTNEQIRGQLETALTQTTAAYNEEENK